MAKKAFVSFLGTSNYVEFRYNIDGTPASPTRFIQEALVERYCKDWGKDDAILIFATTKAKKRNWKDNGHAGETNDLYKQGLEKRFNMMSLNPDLRIECIEIPEVESQEDIWELFDIVNNKIKNYKEIYFDITHGYRFIPMFAMSLFNYSQFVNGTKVVWVKYAMLDNIGDLKEVRKTPLECDEREIQVLDLKSLIELQDWTFAAGQYLKSGNVKQLVEMKDKKKISSRLTSIIDKLGIVIKERQTCRGIKIHTSENVKELKELLKNYKTQECEKSEEPLHNILDKIDESLQYFKDYPDVMNGFYAAKWCCNNGLYQQAITMLRENFITAFCVRNELQYKVEYKNIIDDRKFVEDALNLKKGADVKTGKGYEELTKKIEKAKEECNNKINEAKEECNNIKNDAEEVCNDKINEAKEECNNRIKEIEERMTYYEEKVKELMNDELLKKAIDSGLWKRIRNYRNNFNHNGMDDNYPAEKLEQDIEGFVNKTIEFFNPKPQE